MEKCIKVISLVMLAWKLVSEDLGNPGFDIFLQIKCSLFSENAIYGGERESCMEDEMKLRLKSKYWNKQNTFVIDLISKLELNDL